MRFGETPHPIPYQGSKRQLAPLILSLIPPGRFERMIEPFVGSGAVTLATARGNLCSQFVVGDKLGSLCGIWRHIVTDPRTLSEEYADLWDPQLPDAVAFFNKGREQFNRDGK